ncbi:MAG: HAD family hydrolase [Nitrospiraceae bacterium]|nr:MAG: HAD family hydrolase [Nitrospiraceae bacterium]
MMKELKLPEAILLDMDNSIYEYRPCHEAALAKVESILKEAVCMEPAVFREKYMDARKQIHSRLRNTASSHNRLLYFQRLLELGGHGMKIGLASRLYEIYWETFMNNIRIFEGVFNFLEHARMMNIPVVLVTDLTADIQFRKITRLGLENAVDAVVTSEEAGAEKPSREIFELALKKTGCAGKMIWMIGDSLTKDIAGGKAIGAVTFLRVQDGESPCLSGINPDIVFKSFHELTCILAGCEARSLTCRQPLKEGLP